MNDKHRAYCTSARYAPTVSPRPANLVATTTAATPSQSASKTWVSYLLLGMLLLIMVLRGVRIYQSFARNGQQEARRQAMEKGMDEEIRKFAKAQWDSQWQAASKIADKDVDDILRGLDQRYSAATRPTTTPTNASNASIR